MDHETGLNEFLLFYCWGPSLSRTHPTFIPRNAVFVKRLRSAFLAFTTFKVAPMGPIK